MEKSSDESKRALDSGTAKEIFFFIAVTFDP